MGSTPRVWCGRVSAAIGVLALVIGSGAAQEIRPGGAMIHAVHLGFAPSAPEAQSLAARLWGTYAGILRGGDRLILVEQADDGTFSYHLFVGALTRAQAARVCERLYEAGRFCDVDEGGRRLAALQGVTPPEQEQEAPEETRAAWLDTLFSVGEGRLLRSDSLVDFLKRRYRDDKHYREDAWRIADSEGITESRPYRMEDVVVMRVAEVGENNLGLLLFHRAVEDETNQGRQLRVRVDLVREGDGLRIAAWSLAD